MNDLDDMLARLASMPSPAALGRIDDPVIDRVRALSMRREPSVALVGGGSAAIALLLGVAIAGVVAEHQQHPSELAALTAQTPYAPSTLLGL